MWILLHLVGDDQHLVNLSTSGGGIRVKLKAAKPLKIEPTNTHAPPQAPVWNQKTDHTAMQETTICSLRDSKHD